MTARDLLVFHTLVKESREYNPPTPGTHRKSIYIPTPMEGYGIILSPEETEALYQLLETAAINFKTERLLSLFKTG